MEPLFISQWTHDNHSLYELVPIFRKHPSRILLITMPMVIIIVIFFLALWGIFGFQDYTWLIPLPAACFYFIYVFIDPYLRIHNSFKNKNDFEKTSNNINLTVKDKGIEFKNKSDFEKISFYNDSFQVQIYHNNQIAVSSTYAYTSITSITTTTSLYCFNIKLNKNYIIPIIKNSFIAGNESDFITFFKSKSLF